MNDLSSPPSSGMAYSESDVSIHTILEHLWVPPDKDMSGHGTGSTTFYLLNIPPPKHHMSSTSDLKTFDSFVKGDGTEYIIGMNESSNTETRPDSQMQLKSEVSSNQAARVDSLESKPATRVESDTTTGIIRLECEPGKDGNIRLEPELELEDSGYYFQAEYNGTYISILFRLWS